MGIPTSRSPTENTSVPDICAARGIELNPGEYHNLCNWGSSLKSLGRIEESVVSFTESPRRNPLAPTSCLLAVGLIEDSETNYGQAAGALSRMTGHQVQKTTSLAAACARVGHESPARRAAEESDA